MGYASYGDYQTVYGGTKLTEEQFGRWEPQAGEYLELLTYGRCGEENPPKTGVAVKKACCAMAEELFRQDGEPAVVSHRVGEWSRTYAPEKSRERTLADKARLYLTGTGLLWRGWKRGV